MELKLNATDLENPLSSMTHLEPPAVQAGQSGEGEGLEHVLIKHLLCAYTTQGASCYPIECSQKPLFNEYYYSTFRHKETEAQRCKGGPHTKEVEVLRCAKGFDLPNPPL